MAADDLYAEGARGPGEDAAFFIEGCYAPDGGTQTGLQDADTAAHADGAHFHALDAGDGARPLWPAFDIEKDGPDTRRRDANFDLVTEIRHDSGLRWGALFARCFCLRCFDGG